MNVAIEARSLANIAGILPGNGKNGSLTVIEADKDAQKLLLKTKSPRLGINCSVVLDASVASRGSAIVSTDTLRDATRKSSGVATLRMEDNRLVFEDENSSLKIGVQSHAPRENEQPVTTIATVRADQFATSLRLGRCAGPDEEPEKDKNKNKLNLDCVQLLVENHTLEIASMDGPHLAIASMSAKVSSAMREGITEDQAVWLSKILALEGEELIEIGMNGHVSFSSPRIHVSMTLLHRTLPDYKRSIPPAQPTRFNMKPGEIFNAIDRLRAIAPRTIDVRLSGDQCVIGSKNPRGEEGNVSVKVQPEDKCANDQISMKSDVVAAWDRAVAQSGVADSVFVEFGRTQDGKQFPAALRAGPATLFVVPVIA